MRFATSSFGWFLATRTQRHEEKLTTDFTDFHGFIWATEDTEKAEK